MNKFNVKNVVTRKHYLKWSFRPAFKREKNWKKQEYRINLHKPIYIRTNILDLSKVLMQDFHHNYIKNKYGDKAEMLLRDSDSLIYKVEAENIYEDYRIS